jgi:bacterioferritin (cytochrome b1)
MASRDEVDIEKLRAVLSDAVKSQARSSIHQTFVAATLTGLEAQAVAERLAQSAAAELADTRRLVEKALALGCTPEVEVRTLSAAADPREALTALRDSERETIKALHAVIPETGQEEWSEALEHLLEHLIMRKQEQVDFLSRVLV